ncbi:MAG: hypothetical protein ACXVY5_05470 [Gaiellales bacterium]
MTALALRIYTIVAALIVGVAIVLTLSAQRSAQLWQQQSAAQMQLVRQLALHQPGTKASRAAAIPQAVPASLPVTKTS